MSDFEGFILAGGAWRRMGEDKSRLLLGGRTFVERVAGELKPLVTRIRIVSLREDAASHGLGGVRDVRAGCGALGGIHAAVASCRAPLAFVVSCDLPFVTRGLFQRLAEFCIRGETDAVAPIQ